MLEDVLRYLDEKRTCPHCKKPLTLCNAPPIHVGDGLGWGSEYLFICLNNECPLYVNGWRFIEEQYGHAGSYRHMEIPGSKETYSMMVGGETAFTGNVVDVEELRRQDERYRELQEALADLEAGEARRDTSPALTVLLNDAAPIADRKRALDCLLRLKDPSCVEPLRNHVFKHDDLDQAVNLALAAILKDNFLRECPFCAELIKARAVVCKHCGRELPAGESA